MKKLNAVLIFAVLCVVAACVTINVYFPAAAAEKAAFIAKRDAERAQRAAERKARLPRANVLNAAEHDRYAP